MNDKEKLPIEAFRDVIMACDAPYIIVEGETGSGKSTMVPQWYHEVGNRVLVTEPLIETVIGTSEYVAQLMDVPFGTTVGYRTGKSRQDSPETEILFCTDGLALVRELSHHNRYDILVIDELHEWNTNQSTLEAWAWKHLQAGDSPFQKIVVLSATLDSVELSRKRNNAPIFKVPGRQYPIEDILAGSSLVDDVIRLVRNNHDVLVFEPGKREIENTILELQRAGIGAELIPFHGELERAEKNKAYASYDRPKVVVSTNALETGRTLLPSPGRNLAVVDSGMEKRIELRDGIDALVIAPIARARGMQRRGRTGRVGHGVYIDHCPSANRDAFPIPEILRTRLDQTVLRLAVAGYDATELPFFHDLDTEVIVDAKRALKALGAMDEDGSVNKTGLLMSRLPVSVMRSRMIVEAEKLGVVDDVVTIAAILEVGSLRDKTEKWRSLTKEENSDLLAELDLWKSSQGQKSEELRKKGIFTPSLWRVKELIQKLRDALRQHGVSFGSTGDRESILRACVSGMVDHLYRSDYGLYKNGGNVHRQKARESVIYTNPQWIVGIPRDIQFKDRRGYLRTLYLVTMVSKVDPEWLADVAPQLVRRVVGLNPYYDYSKDSVMSITELYFNDHLIRKEIVEDPEHPQAAKLFATWLSLNSGVALDDVLRRNQELHVKACQLNIRAGQLLFQALDHNELSLWYQQQLRGARRVAEVANPEVLALPELDEELVALVLAENPDEIELLGKMAHVDYFSGSAMAPSVRLPEGCNWQDLPDEGVRLPGGKLVEIIVKLDNSYSYGFSNKNIPQLKEQIRDWLNRQQWDVWTNRPAIALPDLEADEVVFPEIVTTQYGTCTVTGEDLIAYGAVVYNYRRYLSTDPWFKTEWFRVRREAELGLERAKVNFQMSKAQLRHERETKVARSEAEALKRELESLYNEYYSLLGYSSLRTRVYTRRYDEYMPTSSVEMIEAWSSETRALIAEFREAIAQIDIDKEKQRQKQLEENSRLQELARILPQEGSFGEVVYGVPSNGFGPCDPAHAEEWSLYSYHDGLLVRHFGFRSQRTGLTFRELVENYLQGEVSSDWLEEQLALIDEEDGVAKKSARQGGTFTEVGDRHFRCSCGCMERVIKSDWKAYQSGRAISVTCTGCGFTAAMQQSDHPNNGVLSESLSASVDALKSKWGAR